MAKVDRYFSIIALFVLPISAGRYISAVGSGEKEFGSVSSVLAKLVLELTLEKSHVYS